MIIKPVKRVMDLDHPVETLFAEFDFTKQEATGNRDRLYGQDERKKGTLHEDRKRRK